MIGNYCFMYKPKNFLGFCIYYRDFNIVIYMSLAFEKTTDNIVII